MGREIRRVPLDFDWPLDQRWKGFVGPDDGTIDCPDCRIDGQSTGYSCMGQAIYAMAHHNCRTPIIASDAENLLPEERKFMDAIYRSVNPEQYRFRKKHGYPSYVMGRTFVDKRMLCYDIMRHLAKSLRVSMKTFLCSTCKGSGHAIVDPEQHKRASQWRRKAPPKGKGWQVWETVTEGSPITPVFATADELIDHLVQFGTTGDAPATREQATAFVKSGWAPSGAMMNGVMHIGIQVSAAIAS